jgi:1-acyl-sn-glycerol-3-phosphate acyltransferase
VDGPRPTLAYRFTARASGPIVRHLLRATWEGADDLPPGGFVLAPNHLSNFDPWPIGLGLFPNRYLRFMTKAELFKLPFRPFVAALGGIPVRRGEFDRAGFATAVRLCREGQIVVLFPEGTRREKGLFRRRAPRPHTGAARIALRAGVPLVPAAVVGTDRLLRLGPVRVRYGSPVQLDDLREVDRRQAARLATERLMTAIAGLETSL